MEKYLVVPGKKVDIKDFDPNDNSIFDGEKTEGKAELSVCNRELELLQEMLWAEHKRKVLIILAGVDTSGKDGTIRSVFNAVNPQGVNVAHFDVPTRTELARDYLWRIHQKVPAEGEICIFNRSHYEDVLIVRVEGLKPESVWSKRFRHIVEFEKMLYDEGTTIIKFLLNISKDEQKRRIEKRMQNPDKHYKFDPKDIEGRKYWKEYLDAFNDMLNKTSTEYAPWYVIPANRKWYRNIVISQIIVRKLKEMNLQYPKSKYEVHKFTI